jgi:hypothetical protein
VAAAAAEAAAAAAAAAATAAATAAAALAAAAEIEQTLGETLKVLQGEHAELSAAHGTLRGEATELGEAVEQLQAGA